jgi:cobalt-zinc-cadmium efflux system membrane fusion protein
MQRLRWFIAGGIATLILCHLMSMGRKDTRTQNSEHVEEDGHGHESAALSVSKEAQDLLELQSAPVKEAAAEERIAVVGEIAQDPERVEYVVSPHEGIIISIKAQIGVRVKKGEPLAIVRPKGEMSAVEVVSPVDGVVLAQHVKEGDRVDTIASIFTVADLSRLLANFNVYEKDIGRVRQGQQMRIRSIAYPGKEFAGRVTFISPRVEESTHMIKIRAIVENPEYLLKLGMFVTGELICVEDKPSVLVPRSAMYTLEGKEHVFVKTGDVTFEARQVKIGRETDMTVSIVSGVRQGETVVHGNAFLLKSELLKAKMGAGCAE